MLPYSRRTPALFFPRPLLRSSLLGTGLLLWAVCCTSACSSSDSDDEGSGLGGMGGDAHDHEHEHEHGQIEVGQDAPSIEIDAHPDHAAFAIEITTTNFDFAPQHASTEHVEGEGHAHIYVDGEKLTRVYEPWFFLDGLSAGEHHIRVELSANDHSVLTKDGAPIDASLELDVPPPSAPHDHGTQEVDFTPAPLVNLEVISDPKSGWNIHAEVENFQFAPENASSAAIDGEGHVHLYVGDEKIGRLYGPWYHVGTLPIGEQVLRVELAGNDHRTLTVDGSAISDEVAVTVTEDDPHEH